MLLILAVGAVALALGAAFGPAAMQRKGLAEARTMLDHVQPRIDADPRFKHVNLGIMTHPALVVSGDVDDETSLRDLKAIVIAPERSHFHVIWRVRLKRQATSHE